MGQKAMTWARLLAGFILLGILAGMLLCRSARSVLVHTVVLGHHGVWNVVLHAPTGRAFLLAATPSSTILANGETTVQMLDLGTGAIRRTVALGAGLPVTQALDERTQRLFVLTEPGYCGLCHVFVLDARTGSIVRTTRVGLYPGAVAVDAGFRFSRRRGLVPRLFLLA